MSNLQRIRKGKGMSQKQLSEASGINVRMIQFYEQGVKNFDGAGIDRLCDIALALGVQLWEILDSAELAEKVRKCTSLA